MKQLSITVLVLISLFAWQKCEGESEAIVWGPSVDDVQMSCTVSNNIIATGSSFMVTAIVQNSSTNTIYFGDSFAEHDFVVFLTNSSGRRYQLTETGYYTSRMFLALLRPGERRAWGIHVSAGKYYDSRGIVATEKNFPIGDYTLTASRGIEIAKIAYKLESNPLKIEIK